MEQAAFRELLEEANTRAHSNFAPRKCLCIQLIMFKMFQRVSDSRFCHRYDPFWTSKLNDGVTSQLYKFPSFYGVARISIIQTTSAAIVTQVKKSHESSYIKFRVEGFSMILVPRKREGMLNVSR